MLPGLPERNPGLELANAFSVTDQAFPHSRGSGWVSVAFMLNRLNSIPEPTRYREVVLTSWGTAPIAIYWPNCIRTHYWVFVACLSWVNQAWHSGMGWQ